MEQYIWLVFLLLVVFLLVRNADQVKGVVNSLTSANVGAIVALQGGNTSAFTNGG
jgi:hypothetical protein